MKICLLGSTGFLGKHISKKLSKKFSVTKINLRNMPAYDDINFANFLNKFNKFDIVINSVASLLPKSQRDFFINEEFPKILCDHLKKNKKKTKLIHISTINTLINDRKDPYSISKKKSEKKLINTQTTIIRLPLILDKKNKQIQNSGNLSIFFKYLEINLPFYFMIYPGHIYQPVQVDNLMNFILKVILKKNNHFKIYNISGKYKKNLWDLFNEIAAPKEKLCLKINFEKINIFLPHFLKEFFKKKNGLLQQFISIDNTNYKQKTVI